MKKTTKQIEHFFRRKTNIDIFNFDKQNFDIDKKYSQTMINKIEKMKNRQRQIIEKNVTCMHRLCFNSYLITNQISCVI